MIISNHIHAMSSRNRRVLIYCTDQYSGLLRHQESRRIVGSIPTRVRKSQVGNMTGLWYENDIIIFYRVIWPRIMLLVDDDSYVYDYYCEAIKYPLSLRSRIDSRLKRAKNPEFQLFKTVCLM